MNRIQKLLLGVTVSLTVLGGAYAYYIRGHYDTSNLDRGQEAIVEKWEAEHQDRKNLVKEMQAINEAKEEIDEAQDSLKEGDTRKCLDHVVNANGALNKVKKTKVDKTRADLMAIRVELGKAIQAGKI